MVHSDETGHSELRRHAAPAASKLGVWAGVITDDAPAAQVDTEAL